MNGHNVEQNTLKPTSANMWRKGRMEGYSIMLPSENIATIRPVPLDALLENGTIPDFLTPVAAKSLWSDVESEKISDDPDLHEHYLRLINLIIPMAMITPAIVEDPDPEKEEISLRDIDFIDKVAIFNLAIQPSAILKNFRRDQEKRLADLRNSENVRDVTEQGVANPG